MPKLVEPVTPKNVSEAMILQAALGTSTGKVTITEAQYQEFRNNHDEYRLISEYSETSDDYTVELVKVPVGTPIPEMENLLATLKLGALAEERKASRQ